MSKLENKVVLITGASSGFGEDAALMFAAEGCKVVAAARRLDRLQNLVAKIQDAGGEAVAIPVDIVDVAEIRNLVQSTLDLYGQIDILFNNAGIGRVAWFEDYDSERDIDTLIKVNLIGLMQVTREVLPHMLARGEGHIINMASVAGLMSPPLITSYSASKFGLRAFTDTLRREVAPFGIKISGIYPGPASTEFGQHIGKNGAYRAFSSGFDVHMTSEYVARRVVDVAKRPRRSLIIPWWFRIIYVIEALFPSLMDWIYFYFVRKYRKLDKEN